MVLRSRDGKLRLLQQVPLFSGLTRRDLSMIASHTDRVRVDAGTVLFREGGLAREFLIVVEGRVEVASGGRIIGHLDAGRFFGELSLIQGTPQTATVIAATPAVLIAVEGRSFSYLLTAVPELQRRLLVDVCDRLREAKGHRPAPRPGRPAVVPVQP